jgi:hypothetical protein
VVRRGTADPDFIAEYSHRDTEGTEEEKELINLSA